MQGFCKRSYWQRPELSTKNIFLMMIDGFSGRHALPGEESSRVRLPPSRARYTPYYEWCHGGFGSQERVMSSNPVERITAIFFSSLLLFRTRVSNSASKALFSKLSCKVQIWTGSWSRWNLCRFFSPKLWTLSDKRGRVKKWQKIYQLPKFSFNKVQPHLVWRPWWRHSG